MILKATIYHLSSVKTKENKHKRYHYSQVMSKIDIHAFMLACKLQMCNGDPLLLWDVLFISCQ